MSSKRKSLPIEFTSVVACYGIPDPLDPQRRSTRAYAQEKATKLVGKEIGPFKNSVPLYRITDAWLQGDESCGLVFIVARLLDGRRLKAHTREDTGQRGIDTRKVHHLLTVKKGETSVGE